MTDTGMDRGDGPPELAGSPRSHETAMIQPRASTTRLVRRLGVLVISGSVLLLALTACGKSEDAATKKPGGDKAALFPVEAVPVAARRIAPVVVASGSIQAFDTVRVTARVAGTLDRLLVSEGDRVAEGQSIAEIDGARYRLAVVQAESQLTRGRTTLDIARKNAERRESLAQQNLVRTEELEQARAQVQQAEADLLAAQVALDKAKLDLADATVQAPFTGEIQERLVSRGAYLQVGTTLVTLVQRDPLQVRFTITVAEATQLAAKRPVEVSSRGLTGTFSGSIRFIAAAADPATRLVTCLATVDDPDHHLRPGAFAEVRIPIPERTSPAVPELALRTSERGLLAYVVAGDRLEERLVTTGLRSGDGWFEITSGLATGELTVVRASDGLKNGLQVKVVEPRAAGSLTASRGSGRAGMATDTELQGLGR